MEMESSRGRSLDRSRQPGLKKPRLAADEAERDRGANSVIPARGRPFPPRASSGGSQPSDPRFRPTERERDAREEPFRGTSASYQQQQMQELVAQYKTALAELTFNSKPIITNLTIIAGENLHAAKGIAATICANILEVPSEQKLPSLYLLDSIVKNIGRDYIKYFAAKLPEVFCKAYKQVDSPIHPGMRHLFGTWKGVFPPATLQFIEKELGFTPVINGSSSGGTASRPDSQTQRPPHSIHVNPKYLEARQLLEQSNRSKGVSSDNMDSMDTTVEDIVRPNRTSTSGSARQWADPPVKVQNTQRPLRELLNGPAPEKDLNISYRDNEFAADLSRYSDLKIGRINKTISERAGIDSSWYGVGSTVPELSVNQKNGSDVIRMHGGYKPSRPSQAFDQQLPANQGSTITDKNIQVSSRNWKNSEEEEYMWDDMNSKLTDHEGSGASLKGGWDPDDTEKPPSLPGKWMDTNWNKISAYSQMERAPGEDRAPSLRETEEQLPLARGQHDAVLRSHREDSSESLSIGGSLGHRNSLTRKYQEPLLGTGFSHTSLASRISSQIEENQVPLSSGLSTSLGSSFAKAGQGSHSSLSVAAITPGVGSSPSAHSPPSFASFQNKNLHGPNVHDNQHSQLYSQTSQKLAQILGQLNTSLPSKTTQDSFSVTQNPVQQSHSLPNLQPRLSQGSHHIETSPMSSAPLTELRNLLPFLKQSKSDQSLAQEEVHPQVSNDSQRHYGGLPTPNILKDHDTNPGQSSASSLLAAIMKSGLISNDPARSFQDVNVQPPLPSGPPPVQVMSSSTPLVQPSSGLDSISRGNTPPLAVNAMRAVNPPLPPGPPPSSSMVSQDTDKVDENANPLSSLLNSLVAKGLICSSGTERQSKNSIQVSNQLPSETAVLSTTAFVHATSVPDISSTPSSASDLSLPEYPQAKDGGLLQDEATDLKALIGVEFKPEIIRGFHSLVISALFDNLKHQCRVCDLRFQLKEQLGKHLDWHDSRKSEPGKVDRASRKWYVNFDDSAERSVEAPPGSIDLTLLEGMDSSSEKCEPMVPADESQSICALCGEPFEDFYCDVKDEWMYKGTVYMTQSGGEWKPEGVDENGPPGIIVHARCIQGSSADDLEPTEQDNAD